MAKLPKVDNGCEDKISWQKWGPLLMLKGKNFSGVRWKGSGTSWEELDGERSKLATSWSARSVCFLSHSCQREQRATSISPTLCVPRDPRASLPSFLFLCFSLAKLDASGSWTFRLIFEPVERIEAEPEANSGTDGLTDSPDSRRMRQREI